MKTEIILSSFFIPIFTFGSVFAETTSDFLLFTTGAMTFLLLFVLSVFFKEI